MRDDIVANSAYHSIKPLSEIGQVAQNVRDPACTEVELLLQPRSFRGPFANRLISCAILQSNPLHFGKIDKHPTNYKGINFISNKFAVIDYNKLLIHHSPLRIV